MKLLHIKIFIFSLFSTTLLAQVQPKKVMLKKVEFFSGTRGYQEAVTIDNKTIHVTQGGATPRDEQTKLSRTDWKVFKNIIQQINLKKIDQLKAPSNASAVDAARISHFTITTSKGKFESTAFDNYNAPNELMPLIKKTVALAKLKK